ncbi:hypothetical protein ACGFX8_34845 [Streptomyces sp. NPDC048362]|uniref:hypothetical protein n=1 Tax=Streptomyces sp. NPDC048362 TaxID=3365539 RepID=UPI003715C98F
MSRHVGPLDPATRRATPAHHARIRQPRTRTIRTGALHAGLPRPEDDGAAHPSGTRLPPVALTHTTA